MGIKIDKSEVEQMFKELQEMPEYVMKEAHVYLRAQTPVKSGNARRNTKLERKYTIGSRYPYADRLDTGWSNQAPRGFTDPTTKEIDNLVGDKIRKIRD